jgi:hypothetical protein
MTDDKTAVRASWSRNVRRFLRRVLPAITIAMMTIVIGGHVTFAIDSGATDRDIDKKRKAQRTQFSDAEIIDGFFKTSFGSELGRGDTVDRIRKYDRPVRVFVDNRGRPDRRRQVVDIVEDIRSKIDHLDIAMTTVRSEANIIVTLVPERDFAQTLRTHYGAEQAEKIQKSLEPQCLAGLAKDASYRIIRSDVFLVVDAGNFVFADCGYEEILQALGPINDDNSIPWTMFNDNVSLGFFGVYDQLLLNILYHPQIKAGMTRDEVYGVLPAVLPEVRAFVARTNPIAP